MKDKELLNSIGYLFAKICKRRRNMANKMLAEYGIHAGQDVLLFYLGIEDGRKVSQLLENINVQPATISNMVDRMVNHGFVIKVKDKKDMRVSRIFLTEKGKEGVTQVNKVWRALEEQTIKGLSKEEQTVLKNLMRRAFSNFD